MKKLPIAGQSTAATTSFCTEKIEGSGGLSLWVDGNGKITASGGTLENPKPNAFSLVQVEDCPYRTPSCEAACYVHGLEAADKELHDKYRHNSKVIRDMLVDVRWDTRYGVDAGGTFLDWVWRLGEWISDNCNEFRWHVSGDVMSFEHAAWIAQICNESPHVNHWIYTRSIPLIDPLLHAATVNGGNLALNLSADQDNYWMARRVADEHGLRVCYMTTDGTVPDDLKPGDVIFPDYSLRAPKTLTFESSRRQVPMTPSDQRLQSPWWQTLTGEQRHMTCPVDFYGKSEGNRCGPCSKCLT